MPQPHLVCREGLPVTEVQLVPHHLHPLFRVHSQEGALDPGHVSLVHLVGGGGNMNVLLGVRGGSGDMVSSHKLLGKVLACSGGKLRASVDLEQLTGG